MSSSLRDEGSGPAARLLGFFVFVVIGAPLAFTLAREAAEFRIEALSGVFFLLVAKSLAFTFVQASLGAVLSAAIGIGLGLGLALRSGPRARFVSKLSSLLGIFCFVLPGVSVALWVLDLHFNFGFPPAPGLMSIVVAHLLLNTLFIAASTERRCRGWFSAGGAELVESAALLGARGATLLRATLGPLCRAEFRSWTALVFLWSFSAFSTVLILGGGSKASPELLLYYSLHNDPESARILVLVLLQAFIGWRVARAATQFIAGPALFESGEDGVEHGLAWMKQSLVSRAAFWMGWALLTIPVLWFVAAPMASLSLRGFPEFKAYASPMIHSLELALGASFLSVLVATWLVRVGSVARRNVFLLGGLSTTLLAAAWMGAGVDLWFGENPVFQIVLAAAALAVVQLPISALWIEGRLASLPEEIFEAAALLGCGPRDRLSKITKPLLRDVFSRIALTSFVAALGELAVTGLFLKDVEVTAQSARRFAQRYDFSGSSWVLLFMLVCVLAGLALDRGLRLRAKRISV